MMEPIAGIAGTGGGKGGGLQLDCQVQLLYSPTKTRYHLLVKSGLRRHVQIVRVDPVSGALKFTFTYGKDMFPAEAQALEFLKHEGPLEVLASGKHVLGYVVVGPTGLLLLAEKVRVSATLPGNHQVKTVVTSRWYKIPLQMSSVPLNSIGQPPPEPDLGSLSPAQREEYLRGVEKITTFPLDGAHFYCETLDLSRPFPSDRPTTQPSWDFVWNRWLTTAFRGIGLDFVCPHLLQGLCEERALLDFDGSPYNLALISRRGRLHVGPRYKARGLNDYAEPGNEIEVEQVVWRRPAPMSKDTQATASSSMPGQTIPWSRYTWRRGSVPLWWGVHMKNNGLGEAEIKIKEQRTFRGSKRYARRLQKRYTPNPHLDPDDGGVSSSSTTATSPSGMGLAGPREAAAAAAGASAAPASSMGPSIGGRKSISDLSRSVPLLFVSLLRKGTPDRDRSEAKLASAFDYVANALRKEHNIPLDYIAIDWHEMDKQLGSHGIVEAFWQTVQGLLPKHGFALGTMAKTDMDHFDLSRAGMEPSQTSVATALLPRCTSAAGLGWQAHWYKQQRGIARYNCADSLDRTNVGSFFGAAQVFVEQCRELDIAIAVSPKGAANIAALMRKQAVQAHLGAAVAPLGTPGLSLGAGLLHSTSGKGAAGGGRRLSTTSMTLPGLHKDTKEPSHLHSMSYTPKDPAAPGATAAGSATSGSGAAQGQPGRQAPGGMGGANGVGDKLDKFGKELKQSFNILMADLKTPKAGYTPMKPESSSASFTEAAGRLFNATPLANAGMQRPVAWTPSHTHQPAAPPHLHPQQPQPQSAHAPPQQQQQASVQLAAPDAAPKDPLAQQQQLLLAAAADLPPGWEAKYEKNTQRMFFVDHNTRTTHWERPQTPPPSISAPGLSFSVANSPTRVPSPDLGASLAGQSTMMAPAPLQAATGASSLGMAPLSLIPVAGAAGGGGCPVSPTNSVSSTATVASTASTATTQALSLTPLHVPNAGGAAVVAAVAPLSARNANPHGARPHAESYTDLLAHADKDRALRAADDEKELWEPLSPWCMFKASVKGFARRIHPDALSAMAELFLVNGDMSAWLYTGSQAMHSERILLFEPETSKLRKAGVGMYGNVMVGLKRRYNNVLVDTDKQQQIEMFLGMKHAVYFPAVKLYYKEEGLVPLDFPESDDDLDPIAEINWVTSSADKSAHNGTQHTATSTGGATTGGVLGSSGSGAALNAAGQPGQLGNEATTPSGSATHNRNRNKSYTTQELFDAFQRSQFLAHSSTSTTNLAAQGRLGTVTGGGGGGASSTASDPRFNPHLPAALTALGEGPAARVTASGAMGMPGPPLLTNSGSLPTYVRTQNVLGLSGSATPLQDAHPHSSALSLGAQTSVGSQGDLPDSQLLGVAALAELQGSGSVAAAQTATWASSMPSADGPDFHRHTSDLVPGDPAGQRHAAMSWLGPPSPGAVGPNIPRSASVDDLGIVTAGPSGGSAAQARAAMGPAPGWQPQGSGVARPGGGPMQVMRKQLTGGDLGSGAPSVLAGFTAGMHAMQQQVAAGLSAAHNHIRHASLASNSSTGSAGSGTVTPDKLHHGQGHAQYPGQPGGATSAQPVTSSSHTAAQPGHTGLGGALRLGLRKLTDPLSGAGHH